MSVILIFPPNGDLSQPPLGIAEITGYIRKYNKSIKQLDLNIDMIDYFLNSQYLKGCYRYIASRVKLLDDKGKLSKEEEKEYNKIVASFFLGKYVIENIDEALQKVRQVETYENCEIYSAYVSVIEEAMKLVANVHYPLTWSFISLEFSGDILSCHTIQKKLYDEKENLLIPYFRKKIKIVKKEAPKVIGISVNYLSQLIPALTLGRVIKEEMPDCKVILGGSFFQAYINCIEKFNSFNNIIDGIIPFAGEAVWLQIVENLEKNLNIYQIEGIIINKNGNFSEKSMLPIINIIRTLPDYTDFDLNKYLTPYRILPYILSTGCYWGKCTFCCYRYCNTQIGIQKVCRNISKIVKELLYLQEKYQTTYFYFVDEALPPKMMEQLADYIIKEKLPIHWFGEMRLDHCLTKNNFIEHIKKGGCELLLFGMESGTQRILDLMDKGTRVGEVSKILKLCEKYHLNTFIMFFVGFPTETEKEALQTVYFIEEHKKGIQYLSFGYFQLLKNSIIHQNPDKYNISIIENDSDLTFSDNYIVSEGMNERDAKKLVKKLQCYEGFMEYFKSRIISRNHLILLNKNNELKKFKGKQYFDDTMYPKIKGNIIIKELKRDLLDSLELDEIENKTYYYLVDLEEKTYFQVERYVLRLIEYCNLKIPLDNILKLVPDSLRDHIRKIYKLLTEEGIIEWKRE